jgi:hypothetical protein
MCVVAVSEVIIEALNTYRAATRDEAPFQALPMRSWNRGSRKDTRAHLFQYERVKYLGTHALSRFGIGDETAFEKLVPGDLIIMNRTIGSGHTAVFLGFFDRE